jgi:hypothetical protein
MAAEIIYWECPQDGEIFDYDDWRVIQENIWRNDALCPHDRRVLIKKVARFV